MLILHTPHAQIPMSKQSANTHTYLAPDRVLSFGTVPMFQQLCARLNFKNILTPLLTCVYLTLTSALSPTLLPLITLITSNYMTPLMPAPRPVSFSHHTVHF